MMAAGTGGLNVPMFIALRRLTLLWTIVLERFVLQKVHENATLGAVVIMIVGKCNFDGSSWVLCCLPEMSHQKNGKYFQSIGKVHAKALQNLAVCLAQLENIQCHQFLCRLLCLCIVLCLDSNIFQICTKPTGHAGLVKS